MVSVLAVQFSTRCPLRRTPFFTYATSCHIHNNQKGEKMNNYQTPTIIKSIASRIDCLRAQHDLSIRELAHKSGVSKSQLADIIQGNKIPNIFTLHCICNALGISLSDFFDFDDNAIKLRNKEAILIKIFREVSPMSQDTLIKLAKCMK